MRTDYSTSDCIHGMHYRTCSYCKGGVKANERPQFEQDDDDTPRFPPKPERSWGGEGTVTVMGKDDKPVRIPFAMEYMWMVGSRPELASKLSAIAYARVAKTAMKHSKPVPEADERQDIAQTGLLAFMEWLNEQPDKLAARNDIRQLSFFVGAAYFDWLAARSKQPDMRPIDWETGQELGIVERWAEPGTYLPMMKLLTEAREAEHPTDQQERLVRAWAIFDPEFCGRMTRDTSVDPLTAVERKTLQRARESIIPSYDQPTLSRRAITSDEIDSALAALF